MLIKITLQLFCKSYWCDSMKPYLLQVCVFSGIHWIRNECTKKKTNRHQNNTECNDFYRFFSENKIYIFKKIWLIFSKFLILILNIFYCWIVSTVQKIPLMINKSQNIIKNRIFNKLINRRLQCFFSWLLFM